VRDDPFTDRRNGLRRVHMVTASVAAATVVGTGATALALASADRASAQQASIPVQQDTDGGSQDDGVVAPSPSGDGVQLPASPPGRTSGGFGHASSGGS